MKANLIRLIGGDPSDVDALSDVTLRLAAPAWLMTVLVSGVVLSMITWHLYRSSPGGVTPARRGALTLLRSAFLVLAVLMFLQPVLTLERRENVPKTLIVAIDQSGSFDIADPRIDLEDQVRAAIAIGDADPVPGNPVSRAGIAAAAIPANVLIPLRDTLDVQVVGFNDKLANLDADPATWSESLHGHSRLTAIGDALLGIAARYDPARIAGVLLVTDGANTTGVDPGLAATRLRELGIPVHVYGVGTTAPPDVSLLGVDVPDVALAGDAIRLSARLRASGLEGRRARVIVRIGDVEAASKELTLGDSGEQSVTLPIIPTTAGETRLEVIVETEADELFDDNNSASTSLRVVNGSIRVLLADQSPRWEFEYLESMLLREQRVDLDCLLLDADGSLAHTPGSPYIESFPERREQLFAYDLVIIGDIDPGGLTSEQLRLLSDYVGQTGGAELVIIAGKRFSPAAYRDTVIEPLLPVTIGASGTGTARVRANRPMGLDPTDAGIRTAMLELTTDTPVLATWRNLPPVYWIADVGKAKPGAEVLVVRADGDSGYPAGRASATPVIVRQRFGAGEVLFVGTDNTWRWRENEGDQLHTRFWSQVVRRMAGHRLAGGARHMKIETDRRIYQTGDQVTVLAKVRDAAWNPLDALFVTAVLEATDRSDGSLRKSFPLASDPARPGFFRAEVTAPAAGDFRITLPDTGAAPARFEVTGRDDEFTNIALDLPLLEAIAAETGGVFFREDDLHEFPAVLTDRSTVITSIREFDLWSSPLALIILLMLITTEWIVRKQVELK